MLHISGRDVGNKPQSCRGMSPNNLELRECCRHDVT